MPKIAELPYAGRWIDPYQNVFFESSDWFLLRRHVLAIYGGRCMKCGLFGEDAEIHVDHIYPRSLYPERALDLTNLQVLCKQCNEEKSNVHVFDCRPPNWKELIAKGGYLPRKLFSAFLPADCSEFYPLTEFDVLNAVQKYFECNVTLDFVRKQYEKERFIAHLIAHESDILINRLLWSIHFSRHERCLKSYNKYLQKPVGYCHQVMQKHDSSPSKFFGLEGGNFLRRELVDALGGISKNSLAYSVVRLKNDEISHFYQ